MAQHILLRPSPIWCRILQDDEWWRNFGVGIVFEAHAESFARTLRIPAPAWFNAVGQGLHSHPQIYFDRYLSRSRDLEPRSN
jgi:hypothetical protein